MPTTATHLAAPCLAALVLAPATAIAQQVEYSLEHEQRLALDGAGHVRIEHLAGALSVESHDDDAVSVGMVIHAAGETKARARELAETVSLEHGREDSALWMRARPPLDEHRTLFYLPPDNGANYRREVRFDGTPVTIRSRAGWGQEGVPVHVDLHLKLPPGIGLDLIQRAGPVEVRGLIGPVRLKLHNDTVRVSAIEAPLEIDSGNGRVEIRGHRGPARVSSGSGAMTLEDASGGPFELRSSSGRIHLIDVSGRVSAETGSGSVEAAGFRAGDRVSINSGSGDVHLEGDLAPAQDLEVVTKGGDIVLNLAANPDADLRVDSTRGNISIDMPGLSEVRDHRTQFSAVSGEGQGRWRLESRTGEIRVKSDSGVPAVDDLFGDG